MDEGEADEEEADEEKDVVPILSLAHMDGAGRGGGLFENARTVVRLVSQKRFTIGGKSFHPPESRPAEHVAPELLGLGTFGRWRWKEEGEQV